MGPLPRDKTATPGYKRLHGLTPAQQHAIELLLQGKSDQATADALGLHRVTVTRWRNYDPTFRAALNRRRRELWAGTVDRLQALADKALEALAQDLQRQPHPARTALQILRLTGLERSLATLDVSAFLDPALDPTDLPADDLADEYSADPPISAVVPPDTRRAMQDLLRARWEAQHSPRTNPQTHADSPHTRTTEYKEP